MGHLDEMRKYFTTEKQRVFDMDFIKDASEYEAWDEIELGKEYAAANTFEVKAEDMKAFAEAVSDPNPLFNDEEYARNSPYGGLMPHPIFVTPIYFWCTATGPGNWIRTPGARNPGQKIEWYEPFRVGDKITLKLKSYDRWTKRGKYYVTYQGDFFDQNGRLKATWWCTLILPKTKADIIRFIKGEHALEV